MPEPRRQPRWAEGPLPVGPQGRICKVEPGGPQRYVILSHSVQQVWTHYVGLPPAARTMPCTGRSGECVYDHSTTSLKLQGWLAVSGRYDRRVLWLALSFGAMRNCPQLVESGRDLRGLALEVTRAGATRQTRMVARIDLAGPVAKPQHAPPDARAWLCELWGWELAPQLRERVFGAAAADGAAELREGERCERRPGEQLSEYLWRLADTDPETRGL